MSSPSTTETQAGARPLWPSLPLASWADTAATLHMWTQIVGKVRLALSPQINHWWQVPLYVSARGLTTNTMNYRDRALEMEFDFLDHKLAIRDSEGQFKIVQLYERSVADFYAEFTRALKSLAIDVTIWPKPEEEPDPIRFPRTRHTHRTKQNLSAKFTGYCLVRMRCSESFAAAFWERPVRPISSGVASISRDLAPFSGRRAPERADADAVTREAY